MLLLLMLLLLLLFLMLLYKRTTCVHNPAPTEYASGLPIVQSKDSEGLAVGEGLQKVQGSRFGRGLLRCLHAVPLMVCEHPEADVGLVAVCSPPHSSTAWAHLLTEQKTLGSAGEHPASNQLQLIITETRALCLSSLHPQPLCCHYSTTMGKRLPNTTNSDNDGDY